MSQLAEQVISNHLFAQNCNTNVAVYPVFRQRSLQNVNKCDFSGFEMAAVKSSGWPNRKDDYEFRDVIGEQLNVPLCLKRSNVTLVYVVS